MSDPQSKLIRELGSEIDRLRAELAATNRWVEWGKKGWAEDVARAEKAEAALRSIENHELRDWEDYTAVQDIARAHLSTAAKPATVQSDKPMSEGEFNARADAGEAWLRSRGFHDVP